jgi:secondary thiamine-phosphate synthase enzyme
MSYMAVEMTTFDLSFTTSGNTDVIDLTRQVLDRVAETSLEDGQVLLFVPGSTGAITTIEYEHGAVGDLKEAIENLAPEGKYYRHNERWGDGNGHAHVRAALLGPSLTIPVISGRLQLGTWQQIVFIDFDNRPRQRRVIMQVSGKTKKKTKPRGYMKEEGHP